MKAGASTCPRCGTRLHGAFLGSICPRCALEGAGSWGEESTAAEEGDDLSGGWKLGDRIGDYELIDLLGRGGMAVVYLARQISLDRLVALKTVSGALASESHGRERFRREARAIAQLEHPRIVSIYDIGTSGGSMYYTMDYIAGADLGRVMRTRAIPMREAASIVQKVAEAVAYANERGVLHRDLKPGNILLDERTEPYVTDFGIALEAEGAAALTLTGDVMGTPPYMAPEALAGGAGKSGPASEVYALGAILFHLLTGRTPFTGNSASEILHLALNSAPPSPRLLNPGLPRDLETICLKCLEKSPESRYTTAGALADDLRRFLAGENIVARPILAPVRLVRWARRRPAPAALLALLVVSALGATFAAIAFERSRERAVRAETQAREQLFEAQLARAESLRGSKRLGQRTDALAALSAAAKIKVTPALRGATIAALAQIDLRLEKPGPPRPGGNFAFSFAPGLETIVTERKAGVLEWWTGQEGPMKARLDGSAGGRVASPPTFSPDGRFLLARHADNSIRFWSLGDGRLVATLPANPPTEPELAFDLAWRPDSGEFALPRPGGGLVFYSLEGQETRRWENVLAPELVRFSPDGTLIAAVLNKQVVVIDAATFQQRAAVELGAHSRVMDWHPDSKSLAIGCADGRVRVLDAASGNLIQEFIGHRNALISFAYFPDGELAISYGKDTSTRVWDTRTGDALIVLPVIGGTGDVKFSRDGTKAGLPQLTICGQIVEVIRPTVVRQRAATRPSDLGSLVGALDFSADGSRLAVATWGGIEVIDVASRRVQALFPVPDNKREETSVIFAPDGSALYTSSVISGLRRHRPIEGGGFDAGDVLDADKDCLVADITPDGTQLVLVNREKGEVKITDTAGATVRSFTKHPSAMFAALSPDKKWLVTQASGRGDSSKFGARVWSMADETLAKEFDTGPLGFVTFSRDGRWLGAGGVKGFNLVRTGDWSAPHNGLPAAVAKSEGAVVSFSADGELAAVTANEKVYLIHPATGVERGLIVSPSGNTSTARVRLSPDGLRLAVMWDDASLDLWDLATLRRELAALGMEK
ncbi:MAG TPA: WD40 repeat domain-containing serine/threonine protein kinase [Chthoniobacterales bacterium]|nr:WD40 repeat domain-containing serine/threonine protein kinase [Chthoniobacterales bacterium]